MVPALPAASSLLTCAMGGADIILIDRYEAHMKKVAEEGMHFTIHQEEDGGYKDYDYQLKGFRTYTTAADAAAAEGKVDVIIYMTKATQLEQAIQDSLPVVGDSTVAVSLINGLGNDDNLFKVFPKERCIIGSGRAGHGSARARALRVHPGRRRADELRRCGPLGAQRRGLRRDAQVLP